MKSNWGYIFYSIKMQHMPTDLVDISGRIEDIFGNVFNKFHKLEKFIAIKIK